MFLSAKAALILAAGLGRAAMICPLCDSGSGSGVVSALAAPAAPQSPDTAIVRLHVSKMTCGSCPATARLALKRLAGVYSATVTLDDSLGVVRYDPLRTNPTQIAAHLTRFTGFGARILPDTTKTARRPGES